MNVVDYSTCTPEVVYFPIVPNAETNKVRQKGHQFFLSKDLQRTIQKVGVLCTTRNRKRDITMEKIILHGVISQNGYRSVQISRLNFGVQISRLNTLVDMHQPTTRTELHNLEQQFHQCRLTSITLPN
jgi:hypothetical protein